MILISKLVKSLLLTTRDRIRDHMWATEAEEHAGFGVDLRSLQTRLKRESPTVQAVHETTAELKGAIALLAQQARRLDADNEQFYSSLRAALQGFQGLSSKQNITYMGKMLAEHVAELQRTVYTQEEALPRLSGITQQVARLADVICTADRKATKTL